MNDEHPSRYNTPPEVVESVREFQGRKLMSLSAMRAMDLGKGWNADGGLRRRPKARRKVAAG